MKCLKRLNTCLPTEIGPSFSKNLCFTSKRNFSNAYRRKKYNRVSLYRMKKREHAKILKSVEQEYDDKLRQQQSDIRMQKWDGYYNLDDENLLPKPDYSNPVENTNQISLNPNNPNKKYDIFDMTQTHNYGKKLIQPYVQPLNNPYPYPPFNEVRSDPLLVWNEFQERYELKDKRILSEKTKQTFISMNRRFPKQWTKENISKKFAISIDNIDFIFWENEMRRKYKIPIDLDTIKLLEAYCGTDDLIESKVYSMMAYSEVTGDPHYSSGKRYTGSPLIVHEDEKDEYLYSWQKRHKHIPILKKDHYEIIPEEGSGSGKLIPRDTVGNNRTMDTRHNTMIVDLDDDKISKLHGRHMNVKIREENGNLRWATVDECNHAKMKEYPKGITPHQRIRRRARGQPQRHFPRHPMFGNAGYVEHHWW